MQDENAAREGSAPVPMGRRLYEAVARFFFGPDVFISYSRADGVLFAGTLAMSLKDLSVYIDQLGSPPGAAVPTKVLAHARRSTALVVICSPAALRSRRVEDEIAAFPVQSRPVVPVLFSSELPRSEASPWWASRLSGLVVHIEPAEALAQGAPSERLLQRIRMVVGNQRQLRRIRRAGIAGLVLIALTTVGLLGTTWRARAAGEELVRNRAALLESERKLAQATADIKTATAQLGETEKAKTDALGQLSVEKERLVRTTAQANREAQRAKAQRAVTSRLWGLFNEDLQRSYPQPDLLCKGATLELIPPLTIYVPSNESQLTATGRELLDSLASCYARLHNKPMLSIAGHGSAMERHSDDPWVTDTVGDRIDEFALALGQREAAAAVDYLIAKGVPSDRMRTVFYGEERAPRGIPLLSNRIEISVLTPKAPS